MRLRDAIDIHCTFGGGGGDSASSTMPLHGHPETPFNRAKQRKGGEDKGGVSAGGPGSGCEGPNCGRPTSASVEIKKEIRELKAYMKSNGIPKKSVFNGGHSPESYRANARLFELNTKLQQAEKEEIKSAARKQKVKRSALKGTSGGQSDGSSLISRNYKVVDGLGRKLHEFKTKEEAEQASAGNRYTKVWKSTIPDEDTQEVRDMIRKRPGDTQVRTFRKSLPFPNTPFPQGPTTR